MPGMSIHVVDVARGVVARGLRARVERLTDDARLLIAEGAIADDGLLRAPDIAGKLQAGVYEVTFLIGEWLRATSDGAPAVPFLDVVPYRFGIADPSAHYHLPFKFTPWGFSCFRGGA